LQRQNHSRETLSIFNSAKQHHRTLKDISKLDDVVSFLQNCDPAGTSKRSAITSSLIAEFQTENSQCWGSMLLLAYYPYLIRQRKNFDPVRGCNTEDLNSLVLESFLNAADTFPLETQAHYSVVCLTLTTRKKISRAIAKLSNCADKERPWFEGAEDFLSDFAPSPEQVLLKNERERLYSAENIRAWIKSLCQTESKDSYSLSLKRLILSQATAETIKPNQQNTISIKGKLSIIRPKPKGSVAKATNPCKRPSRLAKMLALAHKMQELIDSGKVPDRATLARRLGFSRARVTQLLDLLLLAPDIQEEIVMLEIPAGNKTITEHETRKVLRFCHWQKQRSEWNKILKNN